jgi:predicted phosphodiesterase
MRFGVIADIHGNAFALEAVLQDMDMLALSTAVNLADFFSGPLNAAETAHLLMDRNFPSIRGNHDRYLIEQHSSDMSPSDKAAFDQLDKTHLEWIACLPETLTVFDDVFLCHGTPKSDSTYWLEHVEEDGTVRSATLQEIQAKAEGVEASLILCAHTHSEEGNRLVGVLTSRVSG